MTSFLYQGQIRSSSGNCTDCTRRPLDWGFGCQSTAWQPVRRSRKRDKPLRGEIVLPPQRRFPWFYAFPSRYKVGIILLIGVLLLLSGGQHQLFGHTSLLISSLIHSAGSGESGRDSGINGFFLDPTSFP